MFRFFTLGPRNFVKTKLKVIHYFCASPISQNLMSTLSRNKLPYSHLSKKNPYVLGNKEGINQEKQKQTFTSLQDKQKIFRKVSRKYSLQG